MESAIVGLNSRLRTVYSFVSKTLGSDDTADFVNYQPLTSDPCVFYVRRDRKYPFTLVNVFDGNGRKRWLLQRYSIFDTVWGMYEVPSLKEIATVNAGLFQQSMDFHFKKDLQHRSFISHVGFGKNKAPSRFYLADGAAYEWHLTSMYLERIINIGGGLDETRQRLARVRLMRQFRFDWEVLVDKALIDMEVAIASAFITMLTQWNLGHFTKTTGPTNITATKSLQPSNTFSSYGYPKSWLDKDNNNLDQPRHQLENVSSSADAQESGTNQLVYLPHVIFRTQEQSQPQTLAIQQQDVDQKETVDIEGNEETENRIFLVIENPQGSKLYPIETYTAVSHNDESAAIEVDTPKPGNNPPQDPVKRISSAPCQWASQYYDRMVEQEDTRSDIV